MIGSACRDSSESRLSTLTENTQYVKHIITLSGAFFERAEGLIEELA